MDVEIGHGQSIDVEQYLAGMGDDAKVALVGLVMAADKLEEWNWNARAGGHGSLSFDRRSSEPDTLLAKVITNASVIRKDMKNVTGNEGLKRSLRD